MNYERDIDAEGNGLSLFKLTKYDLRHSHPLCLKFDKF
jgi:hypothetical protein